MSTGKWVVVLFGPCLIGLAVIGCKGEPADNSRTESRTGATQSVTDLDGYLDGVSDTHVLGWAWNPHRVDDALTVGIYDGGTLLSTVTADRMRPDLRDNKVGTGKYGFSLPIPANLRDGKTHEIHAKIEGANVELKQSPAKVVIGPSTQP
jgi:hypothetical protein